MATWAVDALHVRLLVVGEPHMRTDNVDRLADMLTEDIEERQIDAVIVSGSIANEGGEFGADQTTLIDAFEGIGPLVIYHQLGAKPVPLSLNSVNVDSNPVTISSRLAVLHDDAMILHNARDGPMLRDVRPPSTPIVLDQSRRLWTAPPMPPPPSTAGGADAGIPWPTSRCLSHLLYIVGGDEWGMAEHDGDLLVAPGSFDKGRYVLVDVCRQTTMSPWVLSRVLLDSIDEARARWWDKQGDIAARPLPGDSALFPWDHSAA